MKNFFCKYVHSPTNVYIQQDFQSDVLISTGQTTKNMKTNDIPLKSPIKLQQEMQKKF